MNLAFDLISPIINQFQLFIFILQTMHYLKDQISKLPNKSNTKLQNQKSNMIIIYQINNVIQCNQILYNQLGIYLHDLCTISYYNIVH